MTNLSKETRTEVKEIVREKFNGLLNVNKFDVLDEARKKTGEDVHYRDVRDEIENIIYDIADELELDLEKTFIHDPSGAVYVEFIPEYRHRDEDEDDSDIYFEDEAVNESDFNKIEDNTCYAVIKSAGRIFITDEMRKILNMPYSELYVKRDYDNRKIVISLDYHVDRNNFKLTNLRYSQINVANVLGLAEGDTVKIIRKDDTIVIEPAK